MADNDDAIGILNTLRRHLKAGATITATDTEAPVLELRDGNWYGGLTISYPKKGD